MPRELITLQIGQCGNQIGTKFWESALKEHAKINNQSGLYDEALSSFFRNVDNRYADPVDITTQADGSLQKIKCLKARAILIDMEEGVLTRIMRGPLAEIFESRQFITDVSGAGNNWAHGHDVYGPTYRDPILNKFSVMNTLTYAGLSQQYFLRRMTTL